MKVFPVLILASLSAAAFCQTPAHAGKAGGTVQVRQGGDGMKAMVKELKLTPDQAKKIAKIRETEMAEIQKLGPSGVNQASIEKVFHSHDPELKKILSKE